MLYVPSFGDRDEEDEAVLLDNFMLKLSQTREQEIRRGMTLTGPHRDDLSFLSTEGKLRSTVLKDSSVPRLYRLSWRKSS